MVFSINSHNALFFIMMISFLFFLIMSTTATALKFNIPNITTAHENVFIKTYQDASISSEGLQLTPDGRTQYPNQRAGRATYIEPLHLWDKASGNLTDFYTHFSFVIQSQGYVYGDGLAFFLVPSTGYVPATPGGALGLPINVSTPIPFVAVEFDTFQNDWDPRIFPSTHVGININSIASAASTGWYSDVPDGKEVGVWISYSGSSKVMTVGFTNYVSNAIVQQHFLSYAVDLRDYLPEWVAFGFSASTGAVYEKHSVKSWSFSSTL